MKIENIKLLILIRNDFYRDKKLVSFMFFRLMIHFFYFLLFFFYFLFFFSLRFVFLSLIFEILRDIFRCKLRFF